MRIGWRTAPEVAAAIQKVWQREKELQLGAEIDRLIIRHDARGLHRERIARTLSVRAKAISAAK